ncbi:MAG: hypothetical protein ACLT1X_05745 [Christensenellales bacterium]
MRGAMSLRWKLMLTFLVVIGASFAIMASILTGMVSSTLYQQRTSGHPLSGAAGFVGCAFFGVGADGRPLRTPDRAGG